MIPQDKNRMPRWLVESDPSWEKSIDTNLGMLRWTKKGSGIQAICPPTSMFCEILGQDDKPGSDLASPLSAADKVSRRAASIAGDDIAKYLSSRYLNPDVNGPSRLDLGKSLRRF